MASLAADAFIYGFPLVFDLQQVARGITHGIGSVSPAPFNAFSHAATLAGPGERFVSINNDTIYSIANIDASGGPVRFEVPDTAGRYYVMQFVDAWTNNFAYVGHRATVRALQQRLTLTPSGPGAGMPEPEAGVAEDLLFFEQLRVWMQAFPAADRDRRYDWRFEPLGLLARESPYAAPAPTLAAALRDGLAQGRGVLVGDHVRHTGLLPGGQPDRPLLDWRPHSGTPHRGGRLTHDRDAARGAHRT